MTGTRATADVTVVMPAMNREHLIARSLRSVATQTVAPRRVVVVDDASDDDTGRIAAAEGADVLTMPSRSGSGPARNTGAATATSQWIAFLDSDDEWLPDHVERLVAAVEDHAHAVMITAPAITTAGRWMGNPHTRPLTLSPGAMLVPSDLVVTSGTLVRRDVLASTGGFRPLRRAQDLDLWLRVLEEGPGVALTHPSVTYHEHAQQASVDKELMREHFTTIMAGLEDRPWLTPRLRDGAWARVAWDDAREAQRDGRWGEVIRQAGWFASRPWAATALAKVLYQRKRARSRALAHAKHEGANTPVPGLP